MTAPHDGSFTAAPTHTAAWTVARVRPDDAPHELTADALSSLRGA